MMRRMKIYMNNLYKQKIRPWLGANKRRLRKILSKIKWTIYPYYKKIKRVKNSEVPIQKNEENYFPDITVIIPVIENDDLLQKSLVAIWNQSYTKGKISVILSVMGDNYLYYEELVTRYRDEERIIVINTEESEIWSAQKNALTYVKTELLMFLNIGDYLSEGFVEETVKWMTPDVTIVCGNLHDETKGEANTQRKLNINHILGKEKSKIVYDYSKIAFLFDSCCAKIFRSYLMCDYFELENCESRFFGDGIFWNGNYQNLEGGVAIVDLNYDNSYIKRYDENLTSIEDRLMILKSMWKRIDFTKSLNNRLYTMNLVIWNIIQVRKYLETQNIEPLLKVKIEKAIFKIEKKAKKKIQFDQRLDRVIGKKNKSLKTTISVIIPTYKPNDYIETCVKSILKQTYPRKLIKIIISVNGKDLAYVDFLRKRYQGYKNISVIHTPKQGLSVARNFAVSHVNTHTFTFLDDDDFFSTGYIFSMLSKLDFETTIACGKLRDYDMEMNSINNDTYVTKAILKLKSEKTRNYLEIGSCLSPAWAKVYRTSWYRNCCIPFDETLKNTEDIVFWVENIGNIYGCISTCEKESKEACVRLLSFDSMSRPKSNQFKFFITDKIELIERFEELLLVQSLTLNQKRFILTKIQAQTNIARKFYSEANIEVKNDIEGEIKKSNAKLLNKGYFTTIKGIAFCHNFSPFVDASAYVAAKRLDEIAEKEKRVIDWHVFYGDMRKGRSTDYYFQMFYANLHCTKTTKVGSNSYFNEKAQYEWGKEAYDLAKNEKVDYIYSRSLWAGSHVAAYFYKKEHPDVKWYAEFSDPVYLGTDTEKRKIAKKYEGKEEFLNNFWQDVEDKPYEYADVIIFTNKNQQEYMLSYNQNIELVEIARKKSMVMRHPQLDMFYSQLIRSSYQLEQEKINIGYFGSFYPQRTSSDMLSLLENKNVILHLFTPTFKELQNNEELLPYKEQLRISNVVSHLEFLNLASKMDYLYLNDIDYNGEINPYIPSKYADYLSSGTKIIAKINQNTILSKQTCKQLIQVNDAKDITAKLKKKDQKYNDKIVRAYSCDNLELKLTYNLYEKTSKYRYLCRIVNVEECDFNHSLKDYIERYRDSGDSSINTALLNLFSLSEIRISLSILNKLEAITYLRKNIKFFKLFEEYMLENPVNSMVYNDHVIANRVENIIYLYYMLKIHDYNITQNLEDMMINRITIDLELIMGNKYYQKNHNHGIILDRACIIGIIFLNKSTRDVDLQFICERLYRQVQFAYTIEGIHQENSMDYHESVTYWLSGCLSALEYVGCEDTLGLLSKIRLAIDYYIYCIKPDTYIPLVGDTKGIQNRNFLSPVHQLVQGNPYALYVSTKGKKGVMPTIQYKDYKKSGQVFFREHFNQDRFEDATWVSFKAGYETRTHKHQDDLSICLYSKGYDIFVDSGMYNYMPKNPIKDYMESVAAHTTIGIKNRGYSICRGNGEKFKVAYSYHEETFDYAVASSYVYEGVAMYRHLYYMRDKNIVVIFDEVFSDVEQVYQQYYQLGLDVDIKEQNKNCATLSIGGHQVNLYQIQGVDSLRVLRGNESSPMSYMSTGIAQCIESLTLEYSKCGKHVEFVTVVELEPNQGLLDMCFRNRELVIKGKNEERKIQFIEKKPLAFTEIEIYVDHNLKIVERLEIGEKHTIYLWNQRQKKHIKFEYTNLDEIVCDMSELPNGVYEIIYFKVSKDDEAIKAIIGNVEKNDMDMIVHKYDKPRIPKVLGCTNKLEGAEYLCEVQLTYEYPVQVKWWLYRDGAVDTYKVITQGLRNSFNLTEQGEYVPMCSIEDVVFGEVLFHQFDSVVFEEKIFQSNMGQKDKKTDILFNIDSRYDYQIANTSYYKERFVEYASKDEILRVVNKILQGELNFGYRQFEDIYFDINNVERFNWTQENNSHGNTVKLCLYGLRHLYYLGRASLDSKNSMYLTMGIKFISSFELAYEDKIVKDSMATNDHVFAERVENLIHFYYVMKMCRYDITQDLEDIIIKRIKHDLALLMGNKYYQKNHNHGIIVDRACIIGIIFLNANTQDVDLRFICERLNSQVEFAYTIEGIHKENSVDYHGIVTYLLAGCLSALRYVKQRDEIGLISKINKAMEYYIYVTKPNSYLPLLGDSKGVQSTESLSFVYQLVQDDPYALYVSTKGKNGKMPTIRYKDYTKSGQVFFREYFNQDRFEDATWVSFKAGYESRTHKHQDDLSICLYSKGYDIFVDSGMYNYMPKNPIKDYMESVAAHTTIGIKNRGYSICSGNGEKFKIIYSCHEETFDYVVASSYVYDGVVMYRHLYYMRDKNIVAIFDEVFSDVEQVYQQYYQLGLDVVIKTENKNDVTLSVGSHHVNMYQIQDIDSMRVLKGSETSPMSYMSTGFGQCIESMTLEYSKCGKHVEFVTVVELEPTQESLDICFRNRQLVIKEKNDERKIEFIEKNPLTFTEIELYGDSHLKVRSKLETGEKHTIYLWNQRKKDYVKLGYVTLDEVIYDMSELSDGVYEIIYFKASIGDEKIKAVIGMIEKKGMEVNVKKYEKPRQPKILECISQKNGSEYNCKIQMIYEYPVQVKWWLYRNGALESYEMIDQGMMKNFELIKSGEYVAMCSINDSLFGEILFYQFEKVVFDCI